LREQDAEGNIWIGGGGGKVTESWRKWYKELYDLLVYTSPNVNRVIKSKRMW